MRSFPIPTAPTTPTTKISLDSKKAETPRPTKSGAPAEVPVPAGLPLTATRLVSPGFNVVVTHSSVSEEVPPLKRHRLTPASMTLVVDVLLKYGDDHSATLLSKICEAEPPPELTKGWSTN